MMQTENSAIPRFSSFWAALNFYNTRNPVRFKPINLLEAEVVHRHIADEFSIDHPARLWAAVAFSMTAALRIQPPRNRAIFRACYCGDRTKLIHPRDAAVLVGISKRRCYQILEEIRADFERELINRGLMAAEARG